MAADRCINAENGRLMSEYGRIKNGRLSDQCDKSDREFDDQIIFYIKSGLKSLWRLAGTWGLIFFTVLIFSIVDELQNG